MAASKEPIFVGGCVLLTRQVQVKVTPRAWWISKVLGPVTVTPSNDKLDTGDSGTAQNIPEPLAPEAVEAEIFLKIILFQ